MPENRSKTGQWLRGGPSPNPGGRPKGLAKSIRAAVGEDAEAIITFLVDMMNNVEARSADRLRAAQMLLEHGWGRPTQEVERVVTDGPWPRVNDERLNADIREILGELEAGHDRGPPSDATEPERNGA